MSSPARDRGAAPSRRASTISAAPSARASSASVRSGHDDTRPGRDGNAPVVAYATPIDPVCGSSAPLAPGDARPDRPRERLGRRQRRVERVDPARAAPRNSKRRKISFSVERSGGDATSSATSTSSGRSRRIVASSFDARAWSACSMTAFDAGGRELAGVRDHLLERAVLRDQLAGGLVADPRDPRDVVRGVALETDEVRHLVGTDAVPELDPLGRVDVDVRDAPRRHHQRDVLAAELERVAVGRDDARADPRLVRARRERRDHVVRLPALELEVRSSRTPRRSAGSAGTARGAGRASAGGPPCTSPRSPSGGSAACPTRLPTPRGP